MGPDRDVVEGDRHGGGLAKGERLGFWFWSMEGTSGIVKDLKVSRKFNGWLKRESSGLVLWERRSRSRTGFLCRMQYWSSSSAFAYFPDVSENGHYNIAVKRHWKIMHERNRHSLKQISMILSGSLIKMPPGRKSLERLNVSLSIKLGIALLNLLVYHCRDRGGSDQLWTG